MTTGSFCLPEEGSGDFSNLTNESRNSFCSTGFTGILQKKSEGFFKTNVKVSGQK